MVWSIVRAARNRNLSNEQLLFETVAGPPLLGTNEVRVAPRGPGDKERIAKVELRACTVEIACPRHLARGEIASAIGLSCVEAREVDAPKRQDRAALAAADDIQGQGS
jgi:hypothetical protein